MIEEFWIIDTNGICLFHRSIDEKKQIKPGTDLDEQLFGGLLSSILSFHAKLASSQIQKMESEESKFLFFKNFSLIFIVRAKLNTSDSIIKKRVNLIQELFINKFKKELESFTGDIQSFQIFEKELNELFNKASKPEKWGKGLLDI